MARTCPQCKGELPAAGFEGLCPRCLAACLDQFESHEQAEPAASHPHRSASDGAPGLELAEESGLSSPFGVVIPDYELLEEIGRGGMGVVYRARQLSLNRIVAVKTILSGQVASVEAVRRFRGEAEALAGLKHPNIVAVYAIFEWESHHFFSMEYIDGLSLAELARKGSLAPAVAARYGQRIASAFHFAHENGLLHRDLKPANILIDAFDEPRVTDFGLAKRLNAEADLSYTGQLVGSPQYFAPEQLSARKGVIGPRTDVYSIGAVLYHLLTGRPPFNAASLEEVLLQVIDLEPPAPRSLAPTIPRDLETISRKCMEKEPSRRYVSAKEVAEDLDRFLAFEPIKARPIRALVRAWRWWGRRRALTGAWVVILFLLAGFALMLGRRNNGPAPGRAAVYPSSTAFSLTDSFLHDTNWTMKLDPLAKGIDPQAARTSGYTNYGKTFIWTNPVREMSYKVGANSTILAFHLYTNQIYDPSLRGEIKELTASIRAHSIDGAGNTRIAPCLEQGGRCYGYIRPQTATAFDYATSEFRSLTASDFVLPPGPRNQSGLHPDFSAEGKPIQFGFLLRDTDPKKGHNGWTAFTSYTVTAFGPTPSEFPLTDGSFDPGDWTVRQYPHQLPGYVVGTNVHWAETRKRTGGNPGRYLNLNISLDRGAGIRLAHFCQSSIYCPFSQGALEGVDFALDTRLGAETSGRSVSGSIGFIVTQNGALYVFQGAGGGAAYTDQNGGWATIQSIGLTASQFPAPAGFPLPENAPRFPDFSTNGGPIHFGFSTENNAYFRSPSGDGFQMAIDFDNFVVKVHPATGP